MPAARPLSPARFAQSLNALGPFERRPHLAVAVSGGCDSLALALLTADWARARSGRVTAVTVDHGLRRESAAEARQVGAWLKTYGVAHVILRWRGAKPKTGIQAAARAARYALLEEWCRTHGILHLLLAHHRDDQMETIRLRRDAGSQARGLAGMSAIVERAQVRVARPLLPFAKAQLAATLAARGQAWIEDPSNSDPRFARARLRIGEADAPSPLRGMSPRRVARDAQVARWLARVVELHPAGWAWLDLAGLRTADARLSEMALGRVLTTVGGAVHAPGGDSLARAIRRLVQRPVGTGFTLGGCRLLPDETDGRVLLCREAGRVDARARLRRGHSLMWDGRLKIDSALQTGAVAALGEQRPKSLHMAAIPGAARASLPGLRLAGGALAAVGMPGLPAGRGCASAVFRPQRSLAEAGLQPSRMPSGTPPRRKKTIV